MVKHHVKGKKKKSGKKDSESKKQEELLKNLDRFAGSSEVPRGLARFFSAPGLEGPHTHAHRPLRHGSHSRYPTRHCGAVDSYPGPVWNRPE